MRLKSFRAKFIVYIIPLILFVSLSFLAFFINRTGYLIKQGIREMGFSLVRDLSYSSQLAVASEDEFLIMPFLQGIMKQDQVVLVVLYNRNGKIIISQAKTAIEERIPEEIMEELLKGENADVIEKSSFTREGEEVYDFFVPVSTGEILVPIVQMEKEKISGFVRVSLSLDQVNVQNRNMYFIGLIITGLLILLGLVISVFLAKRMGEPIKELTRGAEIIGGGNLEYRIRVKTGDEIEELADSFNQMTENLKHSQSALKESKVNLEVKVEARTKELKELAETLEEQVEERTETLRKRVGELERFRNLTVGRELKMIELKKEIRDLKKKGK